MSRLPLLLAPLLCAFAPGDPRPLDNGSWTPHNVILIVADDVGVDLVQAYDSFYGGGHPLYPNATPNIDQMAYDGLLFRNAWVSPTCSATRSQLMTGQHAHLNGIGAPIGVPGNKSIGLSHSLETLPSVLNQLPLSSPYRNAAVGKWHLAGDAQHPPAPGELFHPLGSSAAPWFHMYGGTMKGKITHPETYNLWTKTRGGLPLIPGGGCTLSEAPYCESVVAKYATVDTASDAIALIQSLPEPFFLYVSFNAAHTPLQAPASELPDPPMGCTLSKPRFDGCIDPQNPDSPHDTRCMVEWLDYEVGRILCVAENTPLGDTTIIFMGDNGSLGLFPSVTTNATVPPFNPLHAKTTVYQGGLNVPFIVKSPLVPRTPQLEDTQALVSATDLFATVVELATGAPPAPDTLRESISFVPVLTGASGSERTHVFAEQFDANFEPEPITGGPPAGYLPKTHDRAIRDLEGFKLIQRYGTGHSCGACVVEEFYDLASDPFEATDLIVRARDTSDPLNQEYTALRAKLDSDYPALWPATTGLCAFESYCTAGTSASGCRANLQAAGTASETAAAGFCLMATGVEGAKDGLFFFGTVGRQANPWGSGTSFQCVLPPVVRAGLVTGTGTGGECDGTLSQDLNSLWCPTCSKPLKNPGAGALVQAQLWYRDPQSTSNQTTSLSDAIEFAVGP